MSAIRTVLSFAGLVVLCMFLQLRFAWADPGSKDLPKWLPNDAIEIELQRSFLYADANDPEVIDLGNLRTKKTYFVSVNYINMASTPVTLNDIKATCGCVGGIRQNALVQPRGKSSFIVIINPRNKEEDFAQKLTAKFDSGADWMFLLKGKVVNDYAATPNQIGQRTSGQEFRIRLNRLADDAPELTGMSVVSLTSFTRVKRISADTSSMDLSVTLKEKSKNGVVELLGIVADDKKVVAEVPITINAIRELHSIPKTIVLRERDDSFQGTATLLGLPEVLAKFPDKAVVKLEGDPVKKGIAVVSDRDRGKLRITLEFERKQFLDERSPSNSMVGTFLNENGEPIGESVTFVYFSK